MLLLILLQFVSLSFLTCTSRFISEDKVIIYLHGKFLEENEQSSYHPEYGKYEFDSIIEVFKKNGFVVLSPLRNSYLDLDHYSDFIIDKIDSLVLSEYKLKNITIVGASKGGYIAQYVSSKLCEPDINFVFIACYRDSDLNSMSNINYCGNVLNIYDRSDSFGTSAIRRAQLSSCPISKFKDLEIHTGLKHGFIFKPRVEWINPTCRWAKGQFNFKEEYYR